MGDLLKGVHLLPQQEYEDALAENKIDDDVIYVTPEDFSSLARDQVERIDKNEVNIATNKQNISNNAVEIQALKTTTGENASELVNIKNTITDIILRDTTQDNRLTTIENNYVNKSTVVTLDGIQTITGPKTFTEHIYLANSDGTVDRISHLNNNFVIHSGATNSSVLNIDEGLEKIYAFNEELAFKSDITESAGTTVYVGGTAVADLSFSSDPQTQINLLAEGFDDDKSELTTNINTKVSKSGDTMTGELIASAGAAFGNNKIRATNSGNTLDVVHIENTTDYNVLNYTHGGIFTLNNNETPIIIQGSDDRPSYVSGSGVMSDLALESDIDFEAIDFAEKERKKSEDNLFDLFYNNTKASFAYTTRVSEHIKFVDGGGDLDKISITSTQTDDGIVYTFSCAPYSGAIIAATFTNLKPSATYSLNFTVDAFDGVYCTFMGHTNDITDPGTYGRTFTTDTNGEYTFKYGIWLVGKTSYTISHVQLVEKAKYTEYQKYYGSVVHKNELDDFYKPKLLWTNPNPGAAFGAQTVTLASNDYDYLLIESCFDTENAAIRNTQYFEKDNGGRIMWINGVSARVGSRDFTLSSDFSQIEFLATYWNGSASSLDAIPTRIYGGKW